MDVSIIYGAEQSILDWETCYNHMAVQPHVIIINEESNNKIYFHFPYILMDYAPLLFISFNKIFNFVKKLQIFI